MEREREGKKRREDRTKLLVSEVKSVLGNQ